MRGASAAGRTAGTVQCLIHDLADGPQTPATLRAAAKTTMNMSSAARRRRIHGGAYFVVAQHVAGTDDHRSKPGARPQHNDMSAIGSFAPSQKQKCSLKTFQTIDEKSLFARAQQRLAVVPPTQDLLAGQDFLGGGAGKRLHHVVDGGLDQRLVVALAHHADHGLGARRAHDEAAAAAELALGRCDG